MSSRDKVNYSMLIEQLFGNIYFVGQYDAEAMLRLATLLANSIPDEDCDEQFYEEIENAYDVYVDETGDYVGYGGSVREVRKKIKVPNPDKLVRAVVNLLRRLDVVNTPKMWEQQQQEVFFQTKYDFRDEEME